MASCWLPWSHLWWEQGWSQPRAVAVGRSAVGEERWVLEEPEPCWGQHCSHRHAQPFCLFPALAFHRCPLPTPGYLQMRCCQAQQRVQLQDHEVEWLQSCFVPVVPGQPVKASELTIYAEEQDRRLSCYHSPKYYVIFVVQLRTYRGFKCLAFYFFNFKKVIKAMPISEIL